MPTPPEVLLDRCLRQTGCPVAGLGYRGKDSLQSLDPIELGKLLEEIQGATNEGLNEAEHIPQHVVCPPFHLDYIDCDQTINAHAFRYEGYSFIAITIPFVYRLWDMSAGLSRAGVIEMPADVSLNEEEWRERLRVTLFRIAFRFVTLHEWTHHVHGHVGDGPIPFNEVPEADEHASLQRQVLELDADGYAAHHTLKGLYRHGWAVDRLLCMGAVPQAIQDDILFSCFVLGTGAIMFPLSAGTKFDTEDLYRDPHPPQAGRMQFLLYQANQWRARHWPTGGVWMAPERFRTLISAVVEVANGVRGFAPSAWNDQNQFLVSPQGIAYLNGIESALNIYWRSFAS